MMRNILILAMLVAAFLTAAPVSAQEIHYWGRMQDAEQRGLIKLHGQYFTVAEGDEIPGVGTVHKVTDDVLIVRRRVTQAEKEQARAAGRAVYDMEEQHIRNITQRLVPSPSR